MNLLSENILVITDQALKPNNAFNCCLFLNDLFWIREQNTQLRGFQGSIDMLLKIVTPPDHCSET